MMHQEEYEIEYDISHLEEDDQLRFEALESMATHNYKMADRFYREAEKNRVQVIVWRLVATVSAGVMAGWYLVDKFL